jgi:hypothetical protein
MAVRKFRRGETTYTCYSCGKLTRNTGDEGQTGLCLDCFNLAGIDNHLSDNGAESMVENCGDEARAIFAHRPELVPLFKDVAEAVNV